MAKSEEGKPTGVNDIQDAIQDSLKDDEEEVQDEEELEEEDVEESESSDDDDSDDSDDSDDEEDSEDEESNDDDSEEEEEEDDEKEESERRFKQFEGETEEDYLKNLEKGYENSSKEGVKLKNKLDVTQRQLNHILKAAEKDPKLAKQLQDVLDSDELPKSTTPKADKKPGKDDDPFLVHARTEWEEKSKKEADEFVKANPEVVDDPQINADVKRWMKVFSRETYEQEGRIMSAGEAMSKAYQFLGLENKLKKDRNLANAAKKNAAPTRPKSKKTKKRSGKQFSDDQLYFAKKAGVSKESLEKYGK